jgi:CelD/BcsL family acetyltransferase involved in cellulose biosynthesis
VTTRHAFDLCGVRDLTAEEAVRWRERQLADTRLRAPTMSLAYLQILDATRPDVRIARLSQGADDAFLGVHIRNCGWTAAGLLFNDWQGLVRPQGSPSDAAFLAEAPALTVGSWREDADGLPGGAVDAVTGYAVELSSGLDAYLEDRRVHAPDHLKKIRRRLRSLEAEHGAVRFAWPDRSSVAQKQLLAWKSAQFRRTGRHDILTSRWLQAFIAAAFESDHADCQAELATLHAGDTLVAAELGFTGLGVNQSWLAAYDPAFARYGPGTLLLHMILQAAPARAIHRVDLGAGHGDYKHYFGNETYTVLSGRYAPAETDVGQAALHRFARWAEHQSFPGARLPGKALRRYAMIAACEPTLAGRAKGVLTALQGPRAPAAPAP